MPAAKVASIEGVVQNEVQDVATSPSPRVTEAKEDAKEEGSANNNPADLETADASDITNLYSYCVEESLDGGSVAKAAVCLLLLCVLTFVQVIYAYGYCDASVLLKSLNALPAYIDNMDKSLFYSNSVITGTSLPLLQCLASVCSIVLLALVMKKDNESTMLTTSPLEHWILGDAAPARAGTANRWTRSTRNFAQRNKFATSTTVIFSSSSAQDESARKKPSQLSPAAIADEMKAELTRLKDLFDEAILPTFPPTPAPPVRPPRAVFELDDFLYQAFLSRSRRDTFESSKPRATSPLSPLNPLGKQLIGFWCWLCFVLDIVMPLLAYFLQRLPKMDPSQTFGYEGITSCEQQQQSDTPTPCETKMPNAPPPPQPRCRRLEPLPLPPPPTLAREMPTPSV